MLRSRYDPQTNRWTKVAPMSTKRLGVAVAVLGSYLYAMGGSDGTSPLNTGRYSLITVIIIIIHLVFTTSCHHHISSVRALLISKSANARIFYNMARQVISFINGEWDNGVKKCD